jgi:nucleoside-diphosphate-sugar epimerase
VQDSLDRPLDVHDVNLTMTLNLLEATRRHGVRRFIFSSSAAVYGDTGEIPAREDRKPCPLSHYAVQKLASEHYCGIYHRLFGLETVCLRYFNIFGPRQRPDSPYSGVIARFLDAARSGRAITIYGDGTQTRDFCYVSNVSGANLAAATLPAEEVAGKSFNVGSGRSTSVAELAEAVRRCFPDATDPVFQPARDGEIRHSQADIGLAVKSLGSSPILDFSDHLRFLCLSTS